MKNLIAQADLLQINVYEEGGNYTVTLTSQASTVIAEVGADSVKAESLYSQLAKRFAETIESELIFFKEEME